MNKKVIHDRVLKYSKSSLKDIASDFKINSNGYDDETVSDNRSKYGANTYVSKKQDSFLHCLRRAFINPFSSILFFIGAISLVTELIADNALHKNFTTIAIIYSMLLISGVVRLIQELRAKRITDNLVKLVNTTVNVLRNGQWQELDSSELVVGDQVKLIAGDRVPSDMRIFESTDLFVSQSVITGESEIVEKNADVIIDNPDNISEYSNTLFSGTTITGGKCNGVVIATGKDTVYGGLNLSETDRKHGFDVGANSIARVLIKFMLIMVPVVFVTSGFMNNNWLSAFTFALSVAVGLTPELLPMVVNACLAKGSYSMGKKQTIVKNINAMQSFGSMDVLCVDKTGTLTGDEVLLEYYMDVLGNESQKTLDYAYLSSFYTTGVVNHLDVAISKVVTMPNKTDYYSDLVKRFPKIDEHPFDYSRKYGSVLLKDGADNLIVIKGSIDEVISNCKYIEHSGKVIEIEEDSQKSVHFIVDEMLEDGMKVIAVAYKKVSNNLLEANLENEFILLGFLAFFDSPKESSISAIKKMQELNLTTKVLTGDNLLVAKSICKRIGINIDRCITGKELDLITDNELPVLVEKVDVFAELTPKQKALIVDTLESNGHTVGFLGDGMNDLPAIIQADVGISVENATDAVKESADVILLKKDLNILEEGVLEGRKAFANMSKYIKITASSNFGNICAIVIASILLPFFPMTSVQLLLLNLLYDILCLVLPWDNVDSDMIKHPLEWSGKKLGGFMTFFGPISSVFDLITFAVMYFIFCPSVCGGAFNTLDLVSQVKFISIFQTGWFLESMWTQILILQLLRTKKLPFIQSKPGKMVVLVTIAGIVLFTMLPISPLGVILGLSVLPVSFYFFLVVNVIMYLLMVTFAKFIYVKKMKKLI